MDNREFSQITIVGAGAIGKLVAAVLVQTGASVSMLVRRTEQATQLNQNGIACIQRHDDKWTVPILAVTDPKVLSPDLVILTVKSFDTEKAGKQISMLHGSPAVISLQNGLGNGELLASMLGEQRILLGTTTYGAISVSDYEVALRGEGELVIGGLCENEQVVEQTVRLFAKAGWQIRIGHDMQREIWKKALINIGINPLTAIYRVGNGEIANRAELREKAIAAVREAGQIAAQLGVLTPAEVEQSVERMLQVSLQTAANRSSMLQDVEKGSQTEIDALNGAIVRLGKEMQVPTPINSELVIKVQQI